MSTFRLEIIGLFRHARPMPKKPRKYVLASGAVSSPPRVRGNHAINKIPIYLSRSIPARAGERLIWNNRNPHPSGLSPRVRGNPRAASAVHVNSGSIPARAGEPANPSSISSTIGVYPRACGGTSSVILTLPPADGLSPRVRGKVAPPHAA